MAGRSDGEPFFYAQKGSWYVWQEGRRQSLGVKGEGNRKEAYRVWLKLSECSQNEPQRPISPPMAFPSPSAPTRQEASVGDSLMGFLADAEGRLKPASVRTYRRFLLPFAEAHGRKLLCQVGTKEAYAFARRPTWSSSTRHSALGCLQTFFRWAGSPLVGLRIPPMESKGMKAVIPEADAMMLIAEARGDMAFVLRFLWLTGCRPSEALMLTAEAFDEAHRLCIIREHKMMAKTGKPRFIYLSPEAVAVVREQRDKHGSGLLFRTGTGKRITLNNALNILWRLNRKLGTTATLYGMRHSYATEGLAKGIPEAHVAELLGHCSTKMLSTHYSHLGVKADAMRASASRVRG